MKVRAIATGSSVVNEQLNKLKSSEAKKIVRVASRESLKPMQARMKSTCPVRRGKMRASIRVRAITRSRKFVGSKITIDDGDKAYQDENKGTVFYASFIIFGRKTGKRVRNKDLGLKKFQRRTKDMKAKAQAMETNRKPIKPNNFMQDAVNNLEDHVRTDYYRRIGLGILSLVKK